MSLDAFWWAELEGFDELARATLSRSSAHGVTGVAIRAVDAIGDTHFASAGSEPPLEALLTLRHTVERDQGSPAPLRWENGWATTSLTRGVRRLGAVAFRVPAPPTDTEWFEELGAELALAVDVAGAQHGEQHARQALAALRRLGARFAGARTATDVAEATTSEAIIALGAPRALVYRTDGAFLELIGTTAGHRPGWWERIKVTMSTPVTDCVREQHAIGLANRDEILDRYPFAADHLPANEQAWLALPLVVDDRPTGALFFAYDDAHTFTSGELSLAATIADQCAPALERARLRHVLDDLHEEESEQRFRAALDAMADLVTIDTAVRDEAGNIIDFRIEYTNQTDIDIAGRAADDIRGRLLLDAYPALRDSALFRGYVQVVETGRPLIVDEIPYADTIDGKAVLGFYSGHIAKYGDGIIISARDISEAREARLELEAAYEQLAVARQIAGLGIWSIHLSSGDVSFSDELYDIFGLDPAQPLPSLNDAIIAFIDPPDVALIQSLVATTPETREPFMIEVTGRRPDGSARTIIVAGTVSLDDTGEPVRMWGTAQDITEQRLAERTLQETTARLAQDHAALLVLQDAISPKLPELELVEVHGVYVPAGEHAHVGGDWFDAMVLPDGALALVVGDVAGHGIAAAALMAQLRHALRAYLIEGFDPSAALAALNRVAHVTGEEPYATCMAATYDPDTRTLLGASAGHLPYLVVRDGVAGYGDVHVGPPIGSPLETRYQSFRATLEARDTLFLFTDGLIERRDELIDAGLARLLAAVTRTDREGLDLADACQRICAQLQPAGPTPDDLCLLALRLPDVSGRTG